MNLKIIIKMKRTIYSISLVIFCIFSIYAQSRHYYIYYPSTDKVHGPYIMPTDVIEDDFGPRDYAGTNNPIGSVCNRVEKCADLINSPNRLSQLSAYQQ